MIFMISYSQFLVYLCKYMLYTRVIHIIRKKSMYFNTFCIYRIILSQTGVLDCFTVYWGILWPHCARTQVTSYISNWVMWKSITSTPGEGTGCEINPPDSIRLPGGSPFRQWNGPFHQTGKDWLVKLQDQASHSVRICLPLSKIPPGAKPSTQFKWSKAAPWA